MTIYVFLMLLYGVQCIFRRSSQDKDEMSWSMEAGSQRSKDPTQPRASLLLLLVPSSDALVTRSDALVPSSLLSLLAFLFLVVRPFVPSSEHCS